MKKSQLREIILEELKGYSKYYPGGKTKGGTSAELGTILKNIALGKDQLTRGNDALDRADQEKVAQILRGEKPVYNEGQEQNYLVSFTAGEDEDDVEVKASSPEEAINKVKSGEVELSYGQKVPRTARAFSAKVWNK